MTIRQFGGVMLISLALVLGVPAVCGVVVYLGIWIRGGYFSATDRLIWQISAEAAAGASAMLAAAVWLLRQKDEAVVKHTSFRLSAQSSPGRSRAGLQGMETLMPLLFAVIYFLQSAGGPWPARLLFVGGGATAVYLGIHGLFLIHEMGHLSVAKCFAMDLQLVQIGTGPLWFGRTVGALRWEWRPLLGGGIVRVADLREPGWRRRFWLFVAGGPAAHALATAAFYGCFIAFEACDFEWGGEVALALLAYAGWSFAVQLFPGKVRVGTVRADNDAAWLLRTPRLAQKEVQEIMIGMGIRRAEMLLEDGRAEAALAQARRVAEVTSGHPAAEFALAYFMAASGEPQQADATLRRVLERSDLPTSTRTALTSCRMATLAKDNRVEEAREFCAECLRCAPDNETRVGLLDAFATMVLSYELRALLPEADRWSAEATARDPTALTLKGTRGGVLFELGRADEGKTLLREVWERSTREVDAAYSAFYLGLIAQSRGNEPELRRWRKRALADAQFAGSEMAKRIRRDLLPTAPIVIASGKNDVRHAVRP